MVQRGELPSGRTRTDVGDERQPEQGARRWQWGRKSGIALARERRERREREKREEEGRVTQRFKLSLVAPTLVAPPALA
jgi:hypothetical protein